MASFFYYGRISSAQIDRWQAPTQQPIIDRSNREIKGLVTMDKNPSLQILGWYVKGTGLG